MTDSSWRQKSRGRTKASFALPQMALRRLGEHRNNSTCIASIIPRTGSERLIDAAPLAAAYQDFKRHATDDEKLSARRTSS